MREKIRHHSAVIVSEVLRVCLLRKRAKKMQERAVILGEEIINDHAKKIMQKQVEDIERRIRETLNKITREKLLLMRLRKSLA
jgi:hypothetical protein